MEWIWKANSKPRCGAGERIQAQGGRRHRNCLGWPYDRFNSNVREAALRNGNRDLCLMPCEVVAELRPKSNTGGISVELARAVDLSECGVAEVPARPLLEFHSRHVIMPALRRPTPWNGMR
jgi:hypothetical protein